MYIRFKRIKKESGNVYEYAYLVGSKWRKRKKQAKQVHSKFLGRSHSFEEIFLEERDLKELVKEKSSREVLNELLSLELVNRGFRKEGNLLLQNNVSVN